jgi:hypothetical protein
MSEVPITNWARIRSHSYRWIGGLPDQWKDASGVGRRGAGRMSAGGDASPSGCRRPPVENKGPGVGWGPASASVARSMPAERV